MTIFRSLLIVTLATASSMQIFGQNPVPAPPAAPPPTPTATTTAPAPPDARIPVPFQNASFEEPAVEKRTEDTKGGNPATLANSDWSHFLRRKGVGEGALNIGTTNEIARTGKQSIYFDFDGITGKRFTATLMTQLMPVKPKHPYKIGMWARLDKDRPLTLDQRRPYLTIEVEFYQEDEETQVGDTEHRVMQIPGALKRLLFNSRSWNQAYGVVRAPAGAALMKVSYVFNVRNEPGKTDGLIFFDDAFIEELPLSFPIEASDEIIVDTDENDEDAADAEKAGEPPKTPVPIR